MTCGYLCLGCAPGIQGQVNVSTPLAPGFLRSRRVVKTDLYRAPSMFLVVFLYLKMW